MEAKSSTRDFGRRALEVESNSVLVATIALIAFIGVMHPDFLSWGQLKEVVQNSVYVGIIAAGMAFLISMREIDLSVGSMFGLSLVVSALLIQGGMNPWIAGLIGVGLGCAMGLFNAVLVQFIAIPAPRVGHARRRRPDHARRARGDEHRCAGARRLRWLIPRPPYPSARAPRRRTAAESTI